MLIHKEVFENLSSAKYLHFFLLINLFSPLKDRLFYHKTDYFGQKLPLVKKSTIKCTNPILISLTKFLITH